MAKKKKNMPNEKDRPWLHIVVIALLGFVVYSNSLTNDFAYDDKVFIRDNNFMGWGASLKIVLDDSIIARLRSGEYVTFYVEPGFHSLGVTEPSLTVPFEKGRTYHFLVFAEYTSFGFGIRRIGQRQAEMWLSKTEPIE